MCRSVLNFENWIIYRNMFVWNVKIWRHESTRDYENHACEAHIVRKNVHFIKILNFLENILFLCHFSSIVVWYALKVISETITRHTLNIHLSIKMCTNTTVYHLHQHPKNILLFMPHWTSDSINKQIIFKTIVCVMMIQNFQLQGKCFVVSLLFLCVSEPRRKHDI